MTMAIEIVASIVTLIVSIAVFYKWKFQYWRNKHVPYVEPRFPFGTLLDPFSKKFVPATELQQHYQHFKSLGAKYGGLYTFFRPTFLPVDPEFIRHIMLKDFQYFQDRGLYHNENVDPLSNNLFNLEGLGWRPLRAKLTPTFTSGKMKAMFPTLVECGNPLLSAVRKVCDRNAAIDIKETVSRFTTDVIGSCAFGIECESFKEPEGDFRKYGRMIFAPLTKFQLFKLSVTNICPSFAKKLGIMVADPQAKIFFLNATKQTIDYRRKNNVTRNDFMQLLMDLKNEDGGEGLTLKEIAAQTFLFFLAGFETSSSTMTFCLYELAMNHEMQQTVREEINSVLENHGGQITYEAIAEMKYLENVIDETLRKYPPVAVIPRVCVKDYKIPETDTVIEKGTVVSIPAYAIHRDPEYFPEPEAFDPDRFNENNKSNIKPFSYMPFGEGPRVCIGLRFGMMQTKVGLAILLRNFKYQLSKKTKLPMKYSVDTVVLTVEGGVWLDIEKV